jgi:hypothetical protein
MKLLGHDIIEGWGYSTAPKVIHVRPGCAGLAIGGASEIGSCWVEGGGLEDRRLLDVRRPLVADLAGAIIVKPRVPLLTVGGGGWASVATLLARLEVEQYGRSADGGAPIPTARAARRWNDRFELTASWARYATYCVDGRAQINLVAENDGVDAMELRVVACVPRVGDDDLTAASDVMQIQAYPTDGTAEEVVIDAGTTYDAELTLSLYDCRPGWVELWARAPLYASVADPLNVVVEAWD